MNEQAIVPSVRTIIADDERLARQKMRLLLNAERGVEVIAECKDGRQTVEAVNELRPELLFLDIRMPHLDGFHVLAKIAAGAMPVIVFTTAFDNYAIKAFEANAMDYLLKPFDQDRLHRAIERARAELLRSHDRGVAGRLISDLLAHVKPPERDPNNRVIIKTEGRLVFLDQDDIDWVEAAANYVRVNTVNASYLLREGIGRFLERLDPGRFARIHRSTIVNVNKIRALQPCDSGEYVAILKNGRELSCSKGCRGQLSRLIEGAR